MIEIYTYPYKTLETVSTTFDFAKDKIPHYNDLQKFEADMVNAMHTANGMGLAANQIGITKRFFAIGHDTFDTFQKSAIIWNPLIKKQSEEKIFDVEGCLSFPGIFVKVERPKQIEIEYETTQGTKQTARLDGMESKCFQHELDHLEGITFNKRVSKLRWDMAKKRK
jgi:peptide deformylase|tara:strand:- start:65 stop:565 length:501 start_codon:yes stop_codon:yes gene_type:complete